MKAINFTGKKVALVVSGYYPVLSAKLVDGAVRKFIQLGGDKVNLDRFDVPGSFEIPQIAQKLVQHNKYDAIICLGIIIQGETAHFEYVCRNVTIGIGDIARMANVPVIFGMLTAHNRDQVIDRLGGAKGHKGEEAMEAALNMMKTLRRVQDTA